MSDNKHDTYDWYIIFSADYIWIEMILEKKGIPYQVYHMWFLYLFTWPQIQDLIMKVSLCMVSTLRHPTVALTASSYFSLCGEAVILDHIW